MIISIDVRHLVPTCFDSAPFWFGLFICLYGFFVAFSSCHIATVLACSKGPKDRLCTELPHWNITTQVRDMAFHYTDTGPTCCCAFR